MLTEVIYGYGGKGADRVHILRQWGANGSAYWCCGNMTSRPHTLAKGADYRSLGLHLCKRCHARRDLANQPIARRGPNLPSQA